jgi:hypothetical protein
MVMNTHLLFEVFQCLVVSILVLTASVYCLLTLAPSFIKGPLKQALLRCPLPNLVMTKLQQNSAAGACGSNCGACPSSARSPSPPAALQTVKWHPRKL